MSVAINEARKELNALAKQMRALLALDEELARVGNMDRLIAERETQLRDLDLKIRASSSELMHLDEKCNSARCSIKNEQKEQQARIAEAKREAERITAKARDEAIDVIRNANANAEKIVRDAEATKKQVMDKVATMQERVKELQAEANDAERRRDEINKEIARIRSLVG